MVGYNIINNAKSLSNNNKVLNNRNIGYGINFNGVDNYVQTSNLGLSTNYNDVFSISLHMNLLATSLPINLFIARQASPLGLFYYLDTITNKLIFVLFDTPTSGETWQVPFIPTINQIQHYCFVYDKGTVYFYVDNQLLSPVFNTRFGTYDGTQNTTNPLGYTLASRPFNNEFTNCVIYDIKIFNTALSSSDVSDLYNYNKVIQPSLLNLTFDSINGLTTPDRSGNGFNGTLVNYNIGDKPLRDVQNTVVNQYTI